MVVRRRLIETAPIPTTLELRRLHMPAAFQTRTPLGNSRAHRLIRNLGENGISDRRGPGAPLSRILALGLLLVGTVALGSPSFGAEAPGSSVPVKSFELDNGMRFLVVERPQMATVAAGWVAHVGSSNERPGITGLAHLFEHMMFKGTSTIGTSNAKRDLEIIAEQEAIQTEIRTIYADLRAAWRRGEIDDPYASANRPPELIELEEQFAGLVEEQRSIMVKDEFDQIYTKQGSSFMNAFTNQDVTVYINTIPANKAELWFWLESDRLLDPVFREFYSERDVVTEERRLRTESTPTGKFDELVTSMFWQAHPYSWPIVGWPSDLRTISKEQADDFFATYYAPNNITAVLVGKITVDQAKGMAEKYFGRIARGAKEPPDVVTLELPQLAEKRMEGSCDCQPQVEIRYHTVPFMHRDSYALDVLAGILNDRTGRLYKALVEGSQVASSAAAFQESNKYAGSFAFSAEAKGEASPEDLEVGWDRVLDELVKQPVSEEELRRVKNGLLADTFRRLENPFFVMIQLALYDGLGDWTYLNTLAERTEAVTATDIERVVKQYFDQRNRIVAQYTREQGSEAATVPAELEGLPPDAQRQIMTQLEQLAAITDVDQLRAAASQLETQVDQVPSNFRAAMQLMLRRVQERMVELEAAGEGEN